MPVYIKKESEMEITAGVAPPGEVDLGQRLRVLRRGRGLSIRILARMSGLNANTLSLIENGKTSPSVSTLQRLAKALGVPMKTFFESGELPKRVVYQKAGRRTQVRFLHGSVEDLGAGLATSSANLLLVSIEPGADSGRTPMIHTGHEFIYCLEGSLDYVIDGETYTLGPGDSLFFRAHVPHRWRNQRSKDNRSLLLLLPGEVQEGDVEEHFASNLTRTKS
jgi:transcriptional regulator with XRE-family HTH domain